MCIEHSIIIIYNESDDDDAFGMCASINCALKKQKEVCLTYTHTHTHKLHETTTFTLYIYILRVATYNIT